MRSNGYESLLHQSSLHMSPAVHASSCFNVGKHYVECSCKTMGTNHDIRPQKQLHRRLFVSMFLSVSFHSFSTQARNLSTLVVRNYSCSFRAQCTRTAIECLRSVGFTARVSGDTKSQAGGLANIRQVCCTYCY